MVFFFIFLSCSRNSNVQCCFFSSSCHALAILMCNGVFVHLLVMLSQFQCAMVVLLILLSSCFFKASNHKNGLVCLFVQLFAFPPPHAPPHPKLISSWTRFHNLHSHCYFLLGILLLCIIPIVEVHIVVPQWVNLDIYLKPFETSHYNR
jgi:hypothetical protein